MIKKIPKSKEVGGFWRRELNGEKYLYGKITINDKEYILELWPNPDKKSDSKQYDIICKSIEI
jgi:hypothetical protein